MRAVRLTQVGKPLENADVPVPEIGPTEVLIRVAAAGICHSDAHYRAGISKIDRLPLTSRTRSRGSRGGSRQRCDAPLSGRPRLRTLFGPLRKLRVLCARLGTILS